MRLIDADALMSRFRPRKKYECFRTDLNGIQIILEEAPTVDLKCPKCGADMKTYPHDEKPKKKAAVERQVIVSWFTPEERTPDPDIIVQATISGSAKSIRFKRTIVPLLYSENEGWYSLDYDFEELTVHAWCDLEPYDR